ncbi:Calumenin-A [Halotydeus destructor]|nr:Calumenin-A [Halotydeus destructor]
MLTSMNNRTVPYTVVFSALILLSRQSQPDSGHNQVAVDGPLSKQSFDTRIVSEKWWLNTESNDGITDDFEVRNLLLQVIDAFIDRDRNGVLDSSEMSLWIVKVQEQLIDEQVKLQFKAFSEGDDQVSYESIMAGINKIADHVTYTRNHRRFQTADLNSDKMLSVSEFRSYLYPADGTLVDEFIERLDVDMDDKLSAEELSAVISSNAVALLDSNQDGYLDTREIRYFVLPPIFYVSDMVDKLMSCDINNDGVLSREEIDNNYDKFIPWLPLNLDTFHLYVQDLGHGNTTKEPFGEDSSEATSGYTSSEFTVSDFDVLNTESSLP